MAANPSLSNSVTVPAISRTEWLWLGIAMVIGAALRLGNLPQVAVEHFDEAVYASNLLFPPEAGGEYPFRQLYAPPLIPTVIEWTTIIGQTIFGSVPTWWPMLPGLVCGLATIPSVWWIGRQWFSPRAGIIAALLIAGNEYHAAYSRTSLTDVPLSLFVLWAVHGFWRALQTGSTRDALIAGGLTALAWWTKYNGWLPLAIAAAGGIAWQLVTPSAERNWSRLARIWLIGGVTAAILWSPVLWDCQKVGGYSAVTANHQRYVDGFPKWGANLWEGVQRLIVYNDFVTWHVVGLALVLILFGPRSLFGPSLDNRLQPGQWLGLCLAASWFGGLVFATPLYYPYPRLWLPWVISAGLITVAGVFLGWNWPLRNLGETLRTLSRFAAGICLAMLILPGAIADKSLLAWPTSWESRIGAFEVSGEISRAVGDPQAPVFVHSEPAIWYHLRQRNQPAVIADGLKFLAQPLPTSAWLVIGPQGLRDSEGTEEWARAAPRLEPAGEFQFTPSHIVLLDNFSPRELREHPDRRTMAVRLYKVRP